MEQHPLVSIIVITYNSAKYVRETLESAKAQTYQNIELIVSDDGSIDDTVAICADWVEKNKDRFIRTRIVQADKNTGVPTNCNRGVMASTGDWLKLIAGDDILFKNNINDNLEFALRKECSFVASWVEEFNDKGAVWTWSIPAHFLRLDSAKQQYYFFLTGNGYLSGGAFFMSRQLFEEVGGFDEQYSLIEDIPFLLKITRHGVHIKAFEAKTIRHRRHDEALTSRKTYRVFPRYSKQLYRCILVFSRGRNELLYLVNAKWHLFLFDLIDKTNWKFLNDVRIRFQPIRLRSFKRIFDRVVLIGRQKMFQ